MRRQQEDRVKRWQEEEGIRRQQEGRDVEAIAGEEGKATATIKRGDSKRRGLSGRAGTSRSLTKLGKGRSQATRAENEAEASMGICQELAAEQ